MDLKEIDINTRNWVDSAQDRDYWRALVNAAVNLWVPYLYRVVLNSFTVREANCCSYFIFWVSELIYKVTAIIRKFTSYIQFLHYAKVILLFRIIQAFSLIHQLTVIKVEEVGEYLQCSSSLNI